MTAYSTGFLKTEPAKTARVIPGFGLSLGVTLTWLCVIVLIPLSSLVFTASGLGFEGFWKVVSSRRVLMGLRTSFSCAFAATAINAFFGVLIAWTLVRYEFPFKRVVDGLIELPFALPTAVAGISLTQLYSDRGIMGGFLGKFGVRAAYSRVGIVIALVFVTVPFVARTIQPVLERLDSRYEESAVTMGAGRAKIWFSVVFPEIFPALLTGFGLAFARALGEYGSVVFIAGNKPFATETAPLLIMTKLQQFDYPGAAAVALVTLAAAFLTLFSINAAQMYFSRFLKGESDGAATSPQKRGLSLAGRLSVGVSCAFLFVMLVMPLGLVLFVSLKSGWGVYWAAVSDKYAVSALRLTLLSTVSAVAANTVFALFAAWLATRFDFRGKKTLMTLIDIPFTVSPVIAGLVFILMFGRIGWAYPLLKKYGIEIVFAVPGIILAVIFVTFPFVARELIPILNARGRGEEEAAALMGAGGWTIFRRITLPNIKWALLYGVILCSARAMGEFGAVSALSGHLRGKTNTLPLHVEVLYNDFKTTQAFAVSSLLVILAVLILIARNIVEYREKKD
jgi:sulfate ABC transporter permease protein CysT/sulfate ABC transporter permease protein CysW